MGVPRLIYYHSSSATFSRRTSSASPLKTEPQRHCHTPAGDDDDLCTATMGPGNDKPGGGNVKIYLRLKPTPETSPLVVTDTVRVGASRCHPSRLFSRQQTSHSFTSAFRCRSRVWPSHETCFTLPFLRRYTEEAEVLPNKGFRG